MADTRKTDAAQLAYAALEELLRRAELHDVTGSAYLRLSLNQGHPTGAKIEIEENFKPQT